MKNRYLAIALVIMLAGVASPLALRAEEEPTPGVARVSLTHGDVSTMRGDSGDWVATTINAPVVRGDKVSTGERSRTEIQLDYANILRLGQRTEAKIADLTRTRIQVQVAQGLVNFTVLKGTEADVEIDTPNAAIRPLGEGSYRIQVNSPTETEVTVRKGEAEVSTPQGSTVVENNRVIIVRGTDNPEYQIAKAAGRDEWDEWNQDRDREIRDAQSWRYTNRYYAGANDLDRHGRWDYVPGYDWCWTPYVNLGWVPYRSGRWVWEPYWGWTWVSYEPWGWAPYHYGRWFLHANSWYWWPGYRHGGYYPTWAPAYVSFLGFGFGGRNWHFGFGFGFGSIGWLPLGPYDAYHPWYGRHNTYNVVNITNITNVRNITNVTNVVNARNGRNRPYASNLQEALNNARVRQALTTASMDDFVRGRVPRNPQAVDAATLRQGQVVQGTLPAVPTRESLRPTDRNVNVASLPARSNRPENFFSRRQPPAGPQSFNERAAQIQEMVRRHNPLQAGSPGTTLAANTNAARNTVGASSVLNAGRGLQPQQGEIPRTGPGNANRPLGANTAQGALNTPGRGAAIPQGGSTQPAATNAGAGAARPEAGQLGRQLPTGERPGWRRFGEPGAGNSPRPNAGGSSPTAEVAQRPASAPSERNQNRPSQPGQERFGSGTPDGARTARQPLAGRPTENRPAARETQPAAAPARPATAPTGRESSGAGGRRFGDSSGRAPWPAPVNVPGRTSQEAVRPQPQARPEAQTERPGWQRFGNAPQGGQPATSGVSPREPRAPSAPTTYRPAPAAPANAEGQSGWRRFTAHPRPAPAERSPAYGAARPEPASPGWNRFPSRRESAPSRPGGWSAPSSRQPSWSPSRPEAPVYREAPRGYERRPLEIRKPIVTERAPRAYEGGGGRAPSGGGRPGGGGGRSAPAPHSAPREGGSRGRLR